MQSHWDSAYGVAGSAVGLMLWYKTSKKEEQQNYELIGKQDHSSQMGKFFHVQRSLKSLEDGVWSLLFPQTTVAGLSITDDWWETQHILFSLRPVQGE